MMIDDDDVLSLSLSGVKKMIANCGYGFSTVDTVPKIFFVHEANKKR
jgi:hypothetical protein